MPKLASEEFVKYLKQFDIVCLTEIFLIGCVQLNSLSDFITFSEQTNKQTNKQNKQKPKTKKHTPTHTNAKQGRPSGGTKVLRRKPIADSFRTITIRYDNMLAFNVPRKKKKKR